MLDLFVIILLVWAAFSGWRAGLIKEIVSAVGFLIGLFIAATCYFSFGKHLAVSGTETNMVTNVIAFFILWIIVPILLGFLANVLTKALKGLQLGLPNSILGAAVSVLKYFVLVSCVLNVMSALHIMNEEKTQASRLYEPVTGALQLFFPADTTTISSSQQSEKADTVWVDVSNHKK